MVTDLEQYLFLSGTSSHRFSKMIGVSRATVDNLRYGRRSVNGYGESITLAIEQRNVELRMALEIGEKLVSESVISH